MTLLSFLLMACTGADGDGGPSSTDTDSGEPEVVTGYQGEEPTYAGESCPELVADNNEGFQSGGLEREFRLLLPENPVGAPVVFAWHWLGGSPSQAIRYMDLETVADDGAIVVVPASAGSAFEWLFTASPEGNADLALFDDVRACLYQQFDVDLSRIWATGFSAGALFTSYLTMYRSDVLASTAIFSGGTEPFITYATPTDPGLPVLLSWGGEDDLFSGLSFEQSTTAFTAELLGDGHFVINCDHGGGHTVPDGGPQYAWEFLQAHPKNPGAEAYEGGLPSDFPEWCWLAGDE